MGAILAAYYRRQASPTISVPAPRDGKGDPWWYDHLSTHMHEYAEAGFSHVMLPPVNLTIGEDAPTSDGYGVLWEYHMGTDADPTRFGTERRLRRCCAIAHANGLKPILDWVPHQRFGGKQGVYQYRSWGGPGMGRFPKNKQCFRGDPDHGWVPQDPVPDAFWDFAFGDELCPINGIPKGYVLEGLQKSGDWIYRSLDLQGCRNDDTKGQAISAVRAWAQYGRMRGKLMIGEYAEGNKDTLRWYLDQVPEAMTYDFEMKYRMRDMCNNTARWNMAQLRHSGLASLGPQYATRAVTFVENPDSDTNGFGAVVFNKVLAYAFVLTAEGFPSVYYRDWAEEKYCYGLKRKINNLLWVHEHLAYGPTAWRATEYQYVVYERLGYPNLLVGLNNDSWGDDKVVNVQTGFGAGVRIHDYTGHGPDLTTDNNGRVTITIPKNDNGTGYVCYSREGQNADNRLTSNPTTQLFEGSRDLLVGPAIPAGNIAGEIWCDEGSGISLDKEWGDGVRFEVRSPDNTVLMPRGSWQGQAPAVGGYKIFAYADFETQYGVDITYKAPRFLKGV